MVANTTGVCEARAEYAHGLLIAEPAAPVNYRTAKPENAPAMKTMASPGCNFGRWCYYGNDVFCQEREGCGNCMLGMRTQE